MTAMRSLLFIFFLALFVPSAHAQWVIQESDTKANLSAIHNVGGGIAWASGMQGTILRTTDEGKTWRRCATAPNAEKLDFRGIQAFDQNTAIVMSSGPGAQSRIYKTTDGCLTWSLVFTNPDAPNGSFKGIQFLDTAGEDRDRGRIGDLIGDPVSGKFVEFRTYDYGQTWGKIEDPAWRTSAKRGEILLAASNSALLGVRSWRLFVTGGAVSRSRTIEEDIKHDPTVFLKSVGGDIPLQHGASAGAASVAVHLGPAETIADPSSKYIVRAVHSGDILVAVGGDPQHPVMSAGTCAISIDGSLHWSAAEVPPGGYRSSVAYNAAAKTWITVGPNGTDISTDEGHTWRALKPSPGEPADADKNWSALSFPFAVGPDGRIGKLRTNAVKP